MHNASVSSLTVVSPQRQGLVPWPIHHQASPQVSGHILPSKDWCRGQYTSRLTHKSMGIFCPARTGAVAKTPAGYLTSLWGSSAQQGLVPWPIHQQATPQVSGHLLPSKDWCRGPYTSRLSHKSIGIFCPANTGAVANTPAG